MSGVYSMGHMAVLPFTDVDRSIWNRWLNPNGFEHLDKIVTLDSDIRKRVLDVDDLTAEDWHQNLNGDFEQTFFWHLDYLLARISTQHIEVFALAYEPYSECADVNPGPRFSFAGYDIMDRDISTSLVLNCGPLPEAFIPSDLNSVGLFQTLSAATTAKGKFLLHYQNHDHVPGCGIWAIWTMNIP